LSDIKQKEEVYISYGSHSDTFLLIEYGFIARNNENNFVDFTLDDIFESLSLSEENKKSIRSKSVNFGCSSGFGLNFDGLTWSTVRFCAITFIPSRDCLEQFIYKSLNLWPEQIQSWTNQRIEEILNKKIKIFKKSREKIGEPILRDYLEDQINMMTHSFNLKLWE